MFNRSGFRSGGYGGAIKPTLPEDFGTSNRAVLSEKRHAGGFVALLMLPQIGLFYLKVVFAKTTDVSLGKYEHNCCSLNKLMDFSLQISNRLKIIALKKTKKKPVIESIWPLWPFYQSCWVAVWYFSSRRGPF